MRARWTAALRSRLGDGAGPYGPLDPAALAEAVELFSSTTETRDIVETCHLVGLLHWRRGRALADERALPELRTASALLALVSLVQPELPVPRPMRRLPGRRVRPDGGATWETLLEHLGVLLDAGADAHSARLAVHAASNAVTDAAGDPALLAGRLRALGIAWLRLYEHTGDVAAVRQAVAAARGSVEYEAPGSPGRAPSLHDLAEALRALFRRTAEIRHLREAVDTGRRAVREVAPDDSKRYLPLGGLADSLRLLYERTDDAALLDEALRLGAAALGAVPESDPARAAVLVNSAILLRHRFERTGDQPVLNEAIAMARRAVAAALPGTPVHRTALYNLGGMLHVHSGRTGDLPALDEAIGAVGSVARATPAGHPDGPLYRSTLVGMLNELFHRTGDARVLDEAIELGRKAVAATPAGHPDRWMHLANLCVVLKARALHTDDLDGLRRVIALERETADLVSAAGGRHQGFVLTNLGNSLRLYFERTGHPPAWEEAVSVGRAAVDRTGEDHSSRAQCEFNLALTLSCPGPAAGDVPVEEAIGLLTAAASRNSAPAAVRVAAAREWGRLSMAAGRPEQAARGFALGVGLLPRLAARGLPHTDATRWMAEYSPLASDAAACALAAGRPDRALEVLEMGRGVLLAQALESRTDLTALRERDPGLADRFDQLCARLDGTTTGPGLPGPLPGAGTPDVEDDPDLRRRLAQELDGLVARIRTLNGLEGFLLPPPAARLIAEAHSGPLVVVNVSRYRCDALVLTTDGIRVCELPGVDHDDVHDRLSRMRYLLGRADSSREARLEAERVMAEDTLPWLWDDVAEPVLDRLGPIPRPEERGARRMWWIPCGPLAHFPLHAAGHHLETPPGGEPRRTVMDRVVSSYAPTVRALSHARARQARPGTSSAGSGRPRVLAVAMPRTPGERDLPGARTEYRHLARLFPAMEGLTGEEATRDAVLSRLAVHPWVHFACHAGTDPDDPYRSHLLVHDHAANPLNVLEISRLRLEESEFAYLSACSTALTGRDLADESLHVVTAFQLAGFPHVVGTLWQVNDTVAVEITEHIYAHLAAGGFDAARAGTSVHGAIRLVRERFPRFPSLWAAHLHMGP
ncbi:CHAT domain-containing protein [Streptomyces sp. NPDC016626]|uniref:CHAT domain-containing protein n=1 Tax=Streptomyces sp. NPDC016626 TaxID=3364968 RepID=UPI0036FEBE80